MKTLFYNGQIVSMVEHKRYEAILIEGKNIIDVGFLDQLENECKNEEVNRIDLKGRTLYPGWIDGHSHFTGVALSLAYPDLSACKDVHEMVAVMKKALPEYLANKSDNPMRFFMGVNYNNNIWPGQKQPTCKDLDEISKDVPILVMNISGHISVVNTEGMKRFGIANDTLDPEGGKYDKFEDGTHNGIMEENASFINCKKLALPSLDEQVGLLKKAQDYYLSYGLTTTHDGRISNLELSLLKKAAEKNLLKIDVNGYVDIMGYPEIWDQNKDLREYKNHIKLAGWKLFIDGSPQQETAWMTKPYLTPAGTTNCGYPHWKDEQIIAELEKAIENNVVVISHVNGDAAVDQYIRCVQQTVNKYNKRTNKWVMIHSQFTRNDQLKYLVEHNLNIMQSFFVSHVWYWGDTHIQNLGFERAKNISPARTALEDGLIYTFHEDSPVVPPSQILALYCATQRITSKGTYLGDSEKIDMYDALKGITINGAIQYGEQNKKGTLEVGKLANFTITDTDFEYATPEQIKNAKVMQTWIEGECLFKQE